MSLKPDYRTLALTEWTPDQLPPEFRLARSRVMYVESKATGLEGEARIGRVYFSKTGKTLYYRGLRFRSLKGNGFKANFFEFTIGSPGLDGTETIACMGATGA